MIHLILYTKPSMSGNGLTLETALAHAFSRPNLTVLRTLPDLKTRLGKPMPYEDSEIYVLVVDSRLDLLELLDLEPYLADKRLILVLPDGERLTLSMAHRLRPRFISLRSEGPDNLCAVIEKMTSKAVPALEEAFKPIPRTWS